MQLGLENKKQTMWAAILGGLAVIAVIWQVLPLLTGSSSAAAPVSAVTTAPLAARVAPRAGNAKAAKKVHAESLDPTLRLDLLASSEKTLYEGNGRNIFVAQAEVIIPQAKGLGVTDTAKVEESIYRLPPVPAAPPIPLKFFGFASKAGEPKKIFLSLGEDVWVAGEGEIVNRRYKVIRIQATSVEMQDVVSSGPPQTIQLTQS